MPEINQAWLALIGAILGGSGLKLIEYWLNKAKVKDDTASSLRTEIRTDLKDCRSELDATEKELYMWRDKYYTLLDEVVTKGYRNKPPVPLPES